MLNIILTDEDCDGDGFPIVWRVAEAIMRSMGVKKTAYRSDVQELHPMARDGIKRWPPFVERGVWDKINTGVGKGMLHPIAPGSDPKKKHTNRDRNDIVDALVPLSQLKDWGEGIGLYAFEIKLSGAEDSKTVKRKLGRKPGQQKEILQKICGALEAWAKENQESFDLQKMPGQVGSMESEGSFHWLCATLYPSEFTKGEKAFKGYRAGLCTFPPYPRPSDFYKRANPHIAQTLGVKINATENKRTGRKAT